MDDSTGWAAGWGLARMAQEGPALTELVVQNSLQSRRSLKGVQGTRSRAPVCAHPRGQGNRSGPLGLAPWLWPWAHCLGPPWPGFAPQAPWCTALFHPSISLPQGLLPIVLEAVASTRRLKRKRHLFHFLPGAPSGNTSPTGYNQGCHTTSCVTP